VGVKEPDDRLVHFLRTVDTPTLSNAIETLDVRLKSEGFTPLGVRCLFPELGPMCGYAVTAQVETMSWAHKGTEEEFVKLFEAVHESRKPAVVVFQEVGPQGDFAAHAGEVMATIFSRLGAIGLVSDCAVRDVAEVRALKFHCFARGTVASHAYFHIVRVGTPIQILGQVIQPGLMIHGDENGLIVVPSEAFAGVAEAVQRVRLREKDLMDFVRSPGFEAQSLRGHFFE